MSMRCKGVELLFALILLPIAIQLSFAQPLFKAFDAGPGWNGLQATTPKGERFCMTMNKVSDTRSLVLRISKLSTQVAFADPALATNSQVPARMEIIVTQKGGEKPLSLVGMAKEIGGPGSGTMIMEGATDGPFLSVLEKGSSMYVIVRDSRVGPYALVGVDRAVAALRKCFSTL